VGCRWCRLVFFLFLSSFMHIYLPRHVKFFFSLVSWNVTSSQAYNVFTHMPLLTMYSTLLFLAFLDINRIGLDLALTEMRRAVFGRHSRDSRINIHYRPIFNLKANTLVSTTRAVARFQHHPQRSAPPYATGLNHHVDFGVTIGSED